MKTGQKLLFQIVLTDLPAQVVSQHCVTGIEVNSQWWGEATNGERSRLVSSETEAWIKDKVWRHYENH